MCSLTELHPRRERGRAVEQANWETHHGTCPSLVSTRTTGRVLSILFLLGILLFVFWCMRCRRTQASAQLAARVWQG